MVDLLVICGDDLLLFSDKAIGLDSEAQNLNVAWSRWFRKAVAESAKQLRGAERWISSFSDRIFLDRKCTQKLVLSLPPVPQRRVHRIVVASGANEACKKYLGNTRGTLAVVPSIVGDAHVNPELSGYQPFSVGDLDPAQPFVHVFDDIALETLLTELDTITDFVQYLTRKEVLVRSGNLARAAGEEELLAYYIRHIDSDGIHRFAPPSGDESWAPEERLVLVEGMWRSAQANPQFVAKKAADRISYFWDDLIFAFTGHLLAGTSILSADTSVDDIEKAVRLMALESRFRRRVHAEAIMGAIKRAPPDKIWQRVFMGMDVDLAYVFVQFPYLEFMKPDYEGYRHARREYLLGYCLSVFSRLRQVKRIVGIAMEPARHAGERSSEDLMLMEPPEWNDALEAEAREFMAHFNLGQAVEVQQSRVLEYPDPPTRSDPRPPNGSRQKQRQKRQRRREQRKARRKNRGR
ncbi:MAG TPA: hypothetical protein VKZ18_09895 [Polyangia bacterium]|nr:hypothetical protein [Polyangia bacterium]